MRKTILGLLLAAFCTAFGADGLFRNGDTLVFMGDTVSVFEDENQPVYPVVLKRLLQADGVDVQIVNAAVKGDTAGKMLARMPEQVVARKPAWMFLMAGVDDVYTPPAKFQSDVEAMCKLCKDNNIKVFLITPTMPKDSGAQKKKLEPLVRFLKEYARTNHIPIADANAWSQEAAKRYPGLRGNRWTSDGVRPAAYAHLELGRLILAAAGYDVASGKMLDAYKRLSDDPAMGPQVSAQFRVSCELYARMLDEAKAEKCSVNEIFARMCKEQVK